MRDTTNYLSDEQLQRILTVARDEFGPREWAMFLIGARHGLRRNELATLKVADIHDGAINCRRAKNSDQTVEALYHHDNTLFDEHAALSAWFAEREAKGDTSAFLFTARHGSGMNGRNVYDLFEKICIRAGVPRGLRNPHQLKHYLGATLNADGHSITFIQKALGHKHVSSSVRYTHVTQRAAAAKVAESFGRRFAAYA